MMQEIHAYFNKLNLYFIIVSFGATCSLGGNVWLFFQNHINRHYKRIAAITLTCASLFFGYFVYVKSMEPTPREVELKTEKQALEVQNNELTAKLAQQLMTISELTTTVSNNVIQINYRDDRLADQKTNYEVMLREKDKRIGEFNDRLGEKNVVDARDRSASNKATIENNAKKKIATESIALYAFPKGTFCQYFPSPAPTIYVMLPGSNKQYKITCGKNCHWEPADRKDAVVVAILPNPGTTVEDVGSSTGIAIFDNLAPKEAKLKIDGQFMQTQIHTYPRKSGPAEFKVTN